MFGGEIARGFSPENAMDFLIGYHVVNIKELETAIAEINKGIDKFQKQRNSILPQLHEHIDGKASERIITNLGL